MRALTFLLVWPWMSNTTVRASSLALDTISLASGWLLDITSGILVAIISSVYLLGTVVLAVPVLASSFSWTVV